jgi:hypothetical protein
MFPYVVYKLKRKPRRETDQEKRTKKFIKKPGQFLEPPGFKAIKAKEM